MNRFTKSISLLTKAEKNTIAFIQVLLIIGMFFEMIGLGLILPLISIIASPDTMMSSPKYQKIFTFFDNPSDYQVLIGVIITLVSIYTLKAVFQYFLLLKQAKFSKSLSRDLSRRLFKGYLFQPYKSTLTQNSAILTRNIENEVGMFSSMIDYFFMFQTNSVLIIGVVSVLMFIEPIGAAFLIFFFIVLGYLFFSKTKVRVEHWSKKRQYHQGLRMKHLFQGINGLKDVKILGRED
ncbi:ABC transporter transmembrane domain-containing protein, partial [Flavobacteriaceae bacterium]|nr:ABC transporter transmembrane domain-containing protein [Flavobacteriaceae bacterium]